MAKQKGPFALISSIAVLGIAGYLMVECITSVKETVDKPVDPKVAFDDNARFGAISHVTGRLKAPSTADVNATVLDSLNNDWAFVLVQADAENSFGAKLRSYYCVVLRTCGSPSCKRNIGSMIECDLPPTAKHFKRAKSEAGWPGF